MKAIAVKPGIPNSVHLVEMPKPSIEDIASERGVLVKVLRVGVDGTDKEIKNAEYGAAPVGDDFLVIGHEGFGVKRLGRTSTNFERETMSLRPFAVQALAFMTLSVRTI